MQESAAREICSLSVKIAEIIIGSAVPHEDMVYSSLKESLKHVTDIKTVKISMNANDAAAISQLPDFASMEITPDPTLNPGDIRLEHEQGLMQAGVNERLEALKEELISRIGKNY